VTGQWAGGTSVGIGAVSWGSAQAPVLNTQQRGLKELPA
jgi:hypothetical protein